MTSPTIIHDDNEAIHVMVGQRSVKKFSAESGIPGNKTIQWYIGSEDTVRHDEVVSLSDTFQMVGNELRFITVPDQPGTFYTQVCATNAQGLSSCISIIIIVGRELEQGEEAAQQLRDELVFILNKSYNNVSSLEEENAARYNEVAGNLKHVLDMSEEDKFSVLEVLGTIGDMKSKLLATFRNGFPDNDAIYQSGEENITMWVTRIYDTFINEAPIFSLTPAGVKNSFSDVIICDNAYITTASALIEDADQIGLLPIQAAYQDAVQFAEQLSTESHSITLKEVAEAGLLFTQVTRNAMRLEQTLDEAKKAISYIDRSLGEALPPRMCCKALTAQCLSCEQGMSIEEYCSRHPDTVGCPKVIPPISTPAPAPTASLTGEVSNLHGDASGLNGFKNSFPDEATANDFIARAGANETANFIARTGGYSKAYQFISIIQDHRVASNFVNNAGGTAAAEFMHTMSSVSLDGISIFAHYGDFDSGLFVKEAGGAVAARFLDLNGQKLTASFLRHAGPTQAGTFVRLVGPTVATDWVGIEPDKTGDFVKQYGPTKTAEFISLVGTKDASEVISHTANLQDVIQKAGSVAQFAKIIVHFGNRNKAIEWINSYDPVDNARQVVKVLVDEALRLAHLVEQAVQFTPILIPICKNVADLVVKTIKETKEAKLSILVVSESPPLSTLSSSAEFSAVYMAVEESLFPQLLKNSVHLIVQLAVIYDSVGTLSVSKWTAKVYAKLGTQFKAIRTALFNAIDNPVHTPPVAWVAAQKSIEELSTAIDEFLEAGLLIEDQLQSDTKLAASHQNLTELASYINEEATKIISNIKSAEYEYAESQGQHIIKDLSQLRHEAYHYKDVWSYYVEAIDKAVDLGNQVKVVIEALLNTFTKQRLAMLSASQIAAIPDDIPQKTRLLCQLTSSLCDPYVNPVYGPAYKLPDKNGVYRYMSSYDDYSARFIIDTDVIELTKEQQANTLMYMIKKDKSRFDHGQMIIDGFFFRNYMITNCGEMLLIDMESNTINNSPLTNMKTSRFTVTVGTEQAPPTYPYDADLDYTEYSISINTHHKSYGDIHIDLYKYENPQMRNAIHVRTEKELTHDNSKGFIMHFQDAAQFSIDRLGSKKDIPSFSQDKVPDMQYNRVNEDFCYEHAGLRTLEFLQQ